MTRIRLTVAGLLGLTLPAGVIAWLYVGDWRHAAAGLVLAVTGLVIGTAPTPKRRTAPWPEREDLPDGS